MNQGSRAAGRWVGRWAFFAALWLALTDTRTEPELIAGAVTAGIVATIAAFVVRPGPPRTASKTLASMPLGAQRLLYPPLRLILDTGMMAGALWRHLVLRRPVRGSFRAVRYTPGAERRSAVGRTLTEIWGSLMPNRYVVGIDEEEATLLVHELVPSNEPLDPLAKR
jgi:multisubunit Na+/H+ antiporter MnhE subunit